MTPEQQRQHERSNQLQAYIEKHLIPELHEQEQDPEIILQALGKAVSLYAAERGIVSSWLAQIVAQIHVFERVNPECKGDVLKVVYKLEGKKP